ALGVHGHSARVLPEHVRSSDRETGCYISFIEDAPYADIVVKLISTGDVSLQTSGVPGTNDSEDNSLFGVCRHQPGVSCEATGDDLERFRITDSQLVKYPDGGHAAPATAICGNGSAE